MTSQTEKSGITANNLNLKYFQPIFKNLSIFVAFGRVNNYFLEKYICPFEAQMYLYLQQSIFWKLLLILSTFSKPLSCWYILFCVHKTEFVLYCTLYYLLLLCISCTSPCTHRTGDGVQLCTYCTCVQVCKPSLRDHSLAGPTNHVSKRRLSILLLCFDWLITVI